MSRRLRLAAAAWLVVAIALSLTSFAGGDISKVSGWLYMLWTAPFSVIWWFYLYEPVLAWVSPNVAQPLGVVLVDVLAFTFWFVFLPILRNALYHRTSD